MSHGKSVPRAVKQRIEPKPYVPVQISQAVMPDAVVVKSKEEDALGLLVVTGFVRKVDADLIRVHDLDSISTIVARFDDKAEDMRLMAGACDEPMKARHYEAQVRLWQARSDVVLVFMEL